MKVQFEKEYLAELYIRGKSKSRKHRFQPGVIRNYRRRIDTLIGAPNVEALYKLNSLNYKVLKGNKSGISSIRIDKKYRLEFKVTTHSSGEAFITICLILDISNHYD
ncbi:MAG: addiction module killer protein [Bacteroidales bacterium]|nr:addiction module killer protein [Bacteroidales bacterium]